MSVDVDISFLPGHFWSSVLFQDRFSVFSDEWLRELFRGAVDFSKHFNGAVQTFGLLNVLVGRFENYAFSVHEFFDSTQVNKSGSVGDKLTCGRVWVSLEILDVNVTVGNFIGAAVEFGGVLLGLKSALGNGFISPHDVVLGVFVTFTELFFIFQDDPMRVYQAENYLAVFLFEPQIRSSRSVKVELDAHDFSDFSDLVSSDVVAEDFLLFEESLDFILDVRLDRLAKAETVQKTFSSWSAVNPLVVDDIAFLVEISAAFLFSHSLVSFLYDVFFLLVYHEEKQSSINERIFKITVWV